MNAIEKMRDESGNVKIKSKLVSFLYQLMRDHVPPGDVESVVKQSESDEFCLYTNGWLAMYSKYIAERLGDNPVKEPNCEYK